MKFERGAPVHWWTRSKGKARCHRAFVDTFPQDKYARVKMASSDGTEVVETSRLRAGWNNWTDHEGRPITPEWWMANKAKGEDMLVKDLVRLLQAAPQDATVWISKDGSYTKASKVDTTLPTGIHTNQSLFISDGKEA